MADVNNYANDLLLDFYDAAHAEIRTVLRTEFGDDWIEQGVRKHFKPEYFDRILGMLRSPMRSVDMDREDDEIFGIEHLWNIINGNWPLFRQRFENKNRTEAYLGEITELRNNLAHRRKRHVLLRSNLIRIIGSCQIVLAALKSPNAEKFADIVDSLSSGGTPWGATLEGHLPPSDEMYSEFVDRPVQLDGLSAWLSSDSPQILVWGYGGAGKSALAYKFARDIRDSANASLIAVCWVSAKRSEYIEGSVRERPADFSDLSSLIKALWIALYGPHEIPEDLRPDHLISELQELPILLVVDDFDTISDDHEITEFLLHELRKTHTRVIYTSRHRIPLRDLEVPPFSETEINDFVLRRSVDYSADQSACVKRLAGIKNVTGGYPLFVDDLIHHAALVGIDEALEDWSQKKGDAARQYALRRQIQYLSHSTGEVLIALSVSNRALRIVEISDIAGLTSDDVEAGIRELLRWRMVNQVMEDDSEAPVYRMNNNTRRLVQQTFKDDGRMRTYAVAFNALTGERVPEAKKNAIGKIVNRTKELSRISFNDAKNFLLNSMTGELVESPDLYGVLGWLYSNQQPLEEYATLAQEAFERSHRLGSSKVDTYYHWAVMEKNIAETMIENAPDLEIPDDSIGDQWKKCETVVENGIDRCGLSQPLCYLAGYAASREAKARGRANRFYHAQGAYARSIDWFRQALDAPMSDVATGNKAAVYRGLTLAYEGLRDENDLRNILLDWYRFSGRVPYFETECRRLLSNFPTLRKVPEFSYLRTRDPF